MTASTPKIFLLHGRASNPQSAKMLALKEICTSMNIDSFTPDLSSTEDPEERIAMFRSHLPPEGTPFILAGSSMGGYVAARISQERSVKGLFLIAPAFYLPHYPSRDISPGGAIVSIVHGWNDEIVPVENSIRYAQEFGAELHLMPGDHVLEAALGKVCDLFRLFLQKSVLAA